jgi:hypothetical protein
MLMAKSRSLLFFLLLLLIAAPAAFPQARGGRGRSGPGTGDPYEQLVAWRFLEKGAPLVKAPLVLYWLPLTADEAERSSLRTSRELFQAADRCVSFEIVLPEDTAMIAKLGETGKLPAALLADAEGNVIRRVEGSRGKLASAPVEKMVRDELSIRGETMYQRITAAKKHASNGDKEGAIDLYRKVWDERCFFPLAGEEARHALKELGVTVVEPPPQFQRDPNLPPVPPTTTAKPKVPGGH